MNECIDIVSTTIVPAPKRRDEQLKGGARRAPRMFSTGLDSAPLPARGLFYSFLAHILFLLATLVVPWSYWMPSDVHLETMNSQIRQQEALLLPELGADGRKQPGGSSQQRWARRSQTEQIPGQICRGKGRPREWSMKGCSRSFPIPPNPDNYIQTIRQPDLPAKPKLPAPLPIPPMVSIAPVTPVLAAPTPQPEPPREAPPVETVITPPLSLPQQLPKVEAPKLPLPASSAQNSSLNAVATAPAPAAMPKLAPPPVPPASGAEWNAQHSCRGRSSHCESPPLRRSLRESCTGLSPCRRVAQHPPVARRAEARLRRVNQGLGVQPALAPVPWQESGNNPAGGGTGAPSGPVPEQARAQGQAAVMPAAAKRRRAMAPGREQGTAPAAALPTPAAEAVPSRTL